MLGRKSGIYAGGMLAILGITASLLAARQNRTNATPANAPAAHEIRVQQKAGTAAPTPLRATTRLVQVSVVVHDKKGEPVGGLAKSDFVVLDDRRPQEIQTFSMQTNQVPVGRPASLPPDTYTNRLLERAGVPTSVTVILLDGLNTKFENQSSARRQVVQFLKQIRPEDHVAIYSLGRDLRVLQDFTNDSSSLLAALQNYKGQYTPSLDASTPEVADTGSTTTDEFLNNAFEQEADFYVRDRVDKTVDALIDIAHHVGTLPGRKNLVWVSGSFPFSVGFDNSVPQYGASVTNLPDPHEFFNGEILEAARAVTDADLVIYPVDARGLIDGALGNQTAAANPWGGSAVACARAMGSRDSSPFPGADPDTFATMNSLANETGGKAYYNSNDIFHSIREAIDDSDITYELGYYPGGVKWDGSFHAIKVEVKRPGVRVRSRTGYYAMPEPQLTPQARQSIIAATATSPLEATQIGVRATVVGYSLQGERNLKLVIAFDPKEFRFEEKDSRWSDSVDGVYIELDNKGQISHAIDETYQLNFEPARFQEFCREGIRYPKEIPIVPGAIELRVILRDTATGNIGDVTIPLAKYFPPGNQGN